jgi:hypothetical protein
LGHDRFHSDDAQYKLNINRSYPSPYRHPASQAWRTLRAVNDGAIGANVGRGAPGRTRAQGREPIKSPFIQMLSNGKPPMRLDAGT